MKERVYVKKDSGWLDVGDFCTPRRGGQPHKTGAGRIAPHQSQPEPESPPISETGTWCLTRAEILYLYYMERRILKLFATWRPQFLS